MMEYNTEDEIYQRRKKRWLTYGRALLTIGILGLLTVVLYKLTYLYSSNESSNITKHASISVSEKVLIKNDKSFFMPKDEFKDKIKDVNQIVVKRSVDNEENKSILINKNIDITRIHQEINNESDNENPKELVNSENSLNNNKESETSQHLKLFRRQQENNDNIHRHMDGGVYIFKSYKCVPIRKNPENLRVHGKKGTLNSYIHVCGCFTQDLFE